MFSNKKKAVNSNNDDEKLNQDFVTHNMPAPHLFSSQTFINESRKKDQAINITQPENHHKIGLLIIGAGLFLIVAIFYFGYSYFIKPMISQPDKNEPQNNQTVQQPIENPTKTAEVLSAETIATDTPIIETSTVAVATTSEEQMFSEETPVVSIPVLASTIDSDADGLTDDEEKITGTDPNKADSDNDTYLDLVELKGGYDPLVPASKLTDSSKTLFYKIDDKTTTVYPASWEISRNDDLKVVIFSNPDKAFIQVVYQDNPGKIKPSVWFSQQFSGLLPGEAISGDNWQGFYSQDGLAAYIFNQDFSKVYTFSCSPLTEDASSIVTFNLVIKSLTIK